MKSELSLLACSLTIVTLTLSPVYADDAPAVAEAPPVLDWLDNTFHREMKSATSIVLSPDQKFAYAAAFNSDTITTFSRNTETGVLKALETVTSPEMDCVVAARISDDGKYVGAVSFRANSLVLLERDEETGKLSGLDSLTGGAAGAENMDFAIELAFSRDSRFIYVAGSSGINAFELKDEKITPIQEVTGATMGGGRCVVVSPDNQYLYGAFKDSKTLMVFKRDEDSGTLETVQTITDGDGTANAIDGIFFISVSPDGKYIYTSAGRFGGDQAVSVFKRGEDGKLTIVQELVEGDEIDGLNGGNEIAVSPDGTLVYALGTLSDNLVRFKRDPATGKLTQIGTKHVGDPVSPGAAGLCFSKDGRFCYVADEDASAIVTFKHVTKKK